MGEKSAIASGPMIEITGKSDFMTSSFTPVWCQASFSQSSDNYILLKKKRISPAIPSLPETT